MPWAKSQQVNPAQVEQYFAQAGNTVGARLPHTQELDGMPCLRFPGTRLRTDRSHQRLFPPLFSRFHLRSDRLDFRCAEFEFRNLPEWIERRIGQNIRGGFHVSEGDEHDAIGDCVILTRVELNSAATGGYAHHVSRFDPELHESAA